MLTPRITKGILLASNICVPLTWNPLDAADTSITDSSGNMPISIASAINMPNNLLDILLAPIRKQILS